MDHARRVVPLLLACAAIGALAACGGGNGASNGESTERGERASARTDAAGTAVQQSAVETIVVRNGEPVGGVRELEYGAGDEIRFRVRSDVADEIHIHGYDLMKDVEAGGTVSFAFPADIEGIFEVELEERGVQIAELRINP